MLLYGISRFVIEYFRGDERGLVFGLLSTSQFISVVIVPLSIGMLVYLSRTSTPDPVQKTRAKAA
jgi:phosphatidylglycerol:prolipoprotein diacylglycerol transferase